MEREISSVTWLAVSLIALAALIGLVIFTVNIGNKTKNDAIEYGVDIAYDLEFGEVRNLKDVCTDLPMASIYNILTKNYQNIECIEVYNAKLATNASENPNKKNDGSLGDIIEVFDSNSGNSDKLNINGATCTSFKANASGKWTKDGLDTPGGAVMSYEILVANNMLNGRGYVTFNKMPSGMYKVKILWY